MAPNPTGNGGGNAAAVVAALTDPKRILGYIEGKQLEGLKYHHPLTGTLCPVILGDHVTLEAGTGLVHTAPGHGEEDYDVGRKYGLEVAAPVDPAGRFTADAGEFAGQQVFEANPAIIDRLAERGSLLSDKKLSIKHPYPHCWRCHQPVIFRATDQWFLSMQKNDLRQKALHEISNVQWIPPWGEDRIRGMIENRPDWCISRQRSWGVPIPVFYCADCGEPLVDPAVMENVAQLFEKEGADAWFSREPKDLGTAGRTCKACGKSEFRKETDILDVWFESGVSFAAVCEPNANLGIPANLYLEGSDQHRGWFHSALLTATGTRGHAPYKAVLTHGFVMDPQGEKQSKSKGNAVPPDLVIKQYGAEILRIWVAATDYRGDVRIDDPKKINQRKGEILETLAEGYRKIRNTLRYCLGNLYDFDASKDAIAPNALLPIDRWARARLNVLVDRVRKAYEDYEFHLVFRAVLDFCAVEMSALYFDILKDRLYTSKANSPARRSGQTVIHQIVRDVLRLLAPVMSFTTDEAWRMLPGTKDESVFLAGFPESHPVAGDDEVVARFEKLFAVRADVLKVLESRRRDKIIGSSLEARIVLWAEGELRALLASQPAELPSLFIVSQVDLSTTPAPADAVTGTVAGLKIGFEKARGTKCPRCWTYREEITEREPLCSRCREALS